MLNSTLGWTLVILFCLPVLLGGWAAIGISLVNDRKTKRDAQRAFQARQASGREEN